MSRGGRTNEREDPERRCIATGEVQPKRGLIRFVIGPEDQIVPDLAEKLPGRGIWVAADRDALEKATSKGLFSRAARTKVTVPADLVAQVEDGLARRVVELVSLARKTGRAVAGFEKVKGWLAEGRAKVLLQASDGSERGKGKLWTPTGGRWFGCLTATELGLSFGRDHVIHGALAAGGLTDKVILEAGRLTGLRGHDGSNSAAGKE
ncbi:RNA-binding protein [Paracoccus sp. 1_MG-2023]|uniref:RNA-binding protein n=1 Tax=unclassified Paracoccus (in: a-proteobacteria) TaxID=2688777 RepID=UPI001C08D5A0|nr:MULTISPECIES: RNA-binding protein [unclassified Paracoccus (in: a-proteobacteria)]MBU2957026.1 RNA-binding protein [Paracoccus sp. C2R09]MDO6668224.1 RNA-binding protein [Paracoccus sp. 1_MG-2023]